MKRDLVLVSLGIILSFGVIAKEVLTPEMLWQVKRVSPLGLNKEKSHVIYKVTTPSVDDNSFSSKVYQVPLEGGAAKLLDAYQGVLKDSKISPDGRKKLFHIFKF